MLSSPVRFTRVSVSHQRLHLANEHVLIVLLRVQEDEAASVLLLIFNTPPSSSRGNTPFNAGSPSPRSRRPSAKALAAAAAKR